MKREEKAIYQYIVSDEKSWGELAEAFCCSTTVLKALNGSTGMDLRPGMRVLIPANRCPRGYFYKIKKGQSVCAIAIGSGIPLENILQSNPGIDIRRCTPGQILVLPAEGPRYPGNTKRYVVKKKDTLARLVRKSGMNIPLLEQMNPEADLFALREGDILRVIDWGLP